MADIFLSYAHVDRPRARPLVRLLESEGWTVWWDRGIMPGEQWQQPLEKELARSRAIVVLWSKNSAKSKWVRREADAGLEKGALVPILLDKHGPPGQFAKYQATDLSGWKGESHLDEVQALLRRLGNLVPPSRIDTIRPGYDPKFLGDDFPVPLPGVTGSAAVLRYLHFTVVMNPARRIAHYVAYNINAEQFVRIRRGDEWAADSLIPESLQIERSLLSHSPYDRGHLVSQLTVSWGKKREAFISARQAFFWTNVAPQHKRLNRQWWLALEHWEREVSVAHGRAIGFSGPVFSEEDEPFRGEVELEDGLVAFDTFRVPRAYWKIVVAIAQDNKLSVAAYLMDQFKMLETKVGGDIDLSKYRVSLKELEKSTQLHICQALHDAAELRLKYK